MSDDESTQQIDLEALRESLDRKKAATNPESERETSRGVDPSTSFEDETVMTPPDPRNLRKSLRQIDSEGTAVTRIDPDARADIVINLQGDLPTLEPQLVAACAAPLSAIMMIAMTSAAMRCELRRKQARTYSSTAARNA